MSALTPYAFEGQDIRAHLDDDGEAWFVASDICAALGYSKPRDAVARLDAEQRGSITVDTPGGPQRAVTVSLDGLNDLVLDSRKPEARRIRRWVTRDVLPAIQRTGSYSTAPEPTEDEIVHQALTITARKVEALTAQIEADAPKVAYVETYVADSDLLTVRTVAANLGVQETWLRELLIARKWVYVETATRWSEREQKKVEVRRYSAYADKKAYFTPKLVHDAPRFKGEAMHTLKVTPAGAEAIARLVKVALNTPTLTVVAS